MEGADRQSFEKVTKAMHWPKPPQPAKSAALSGTGTPARAPFEPGRLPVPAN
jgi:hypothetical protein